MEHCLAAHPKKRRLRERTVGAYWTAWLKLEYMRRKLASRLKNSGVRALHITRENEDFGRKNEHVRLVCPSTWQKKTSSMILCLQTTQRQIQE